MKKLICLLLALIMVVSMTACGDENKKPYEEAVAAYNNGYYEEAAAKLAALGDYKDAATLLASIKAEKAGVALDVTTADLGNCTSETLNHADGGKTMVSHFYEGTNKVRTIRTNPNNSKDTYEYTCDENGKVLSHVLTLADGTVEEATYSYNEQGQLTVISAASGNTTFEYNAFGDVVKEAVEANGEVVSATTYAYTYMFSIA